MRTVHLFWFKINTTKLLVKSRQSWLSWWSFDRTVTNTHKIPFQFHFVYRQYIHVNVALKEGELVTGKRVFQRGKRDGPLKDDEEEEESDVEARITKV